MKEMQRRALGWLALAGLLLVGIHCNIVVGLNILKDCPGDPSCPPDATCHDGVKDGFETGVDCGGPCAACATGQSCNKGSDCESGICTSGACAVPSCSDMVKNQDESDTDCGGKTCMPCGEGRVCGAPSDCTSMVCTGERCGPPAGFAFAIKDASVNVPYGGINYVTLAVTPAAGYNGAIDVTVKGPPAGLTTMPLTIAAGATSGKLQVGAGSTLSIGTMLTLTLVATSGAISQMASVPAVVTGKPGDLDMSFGSGGITTGPSGTGWAYFNDILEVGQGKLLAGGVSVVKVGGVTLMGARYLANGMPDVSFNSSGYVQASGGCTTGNGDIANVAREADGTVLLVGWGCAGSPLKHDIFLLRYTDSGSPSMVQGDLGTENIDIGGDDQVTAAALVPSSTKVIVAGSKDGQLVVARIQDRQAFGAPDTTFAAPDGWIVPSLGGTGSGAGALAIDSTGNIVVGGWVTTASGDDAVLLRLSSDGSLDPSFGTGGVVTLTRPGNQRGSAVRVQADGKILLASTTDESGSPQLLVQRLFPSGQPDAGFGASGAALAPLGAKLSSNVQSRGALLADMSDGRVVVAATGTIGATSGPVVARLLQDGTLDATFGTGGEAALYVGDRGVVRALTLTSDGKLVLGGGISQLPGQSFIARLWN